MLSCFSAIDCNDDSRLPGQIDACRPSSGCVSCVHAARGRRAGPTKMQAPCPCLSPRTACRMARPPRGHMSKCKCTAPMYRTQLCVCVCVSVTRHILYAVAQVCTHWCFGWLQRTSFKQPSPLAPPLHQPVLKRHALHPTGGPVACTWHDMRSEARRNITSRGPQAAEAASSSTCLTTSWSVRPRRRGQGPPRLPQRAPPATQQGQRSRRT